MADLVARASTLLRSVGWTVAVNRPFAGTIVPLRYHEKDRRVSSLMIEVNRRLYMHEESGMRRTSFGEVRASISSVLTALIADP